MIGPMIREARKLIDRIDIKEEITPHEEIE